MAIAGKKLSELTDKLEDIQGNERLYVSDGTGVPKYVETGKFATATKLDEKGDKVGEISGSSGEVSQEIKPNTFYRFGECTALNITLGSKIEGVYNEYMFQFTSGETATVLGDIAGVKWVGDNTINPNTTYVVVIHDGTLAVLGGA